MIFVVQKSQDICILVGTTTKWNTSMLTQNLSSINSSSDKVTPEKWGGGAWPAQSQNSVRVGVCMLRKDAPCCMARQRNKHSPSEYKKNHDACLFKVYTNICFLSKKMGAHHNCIQWGIRVNETHKMNLTWFFPQNIENWVSHFEHAYRCLCHWFHAKRPENPF